jgi:TP901-1 family phage major tail protein
MKGREKVALILKKPSEGNMTAQRGKDILLKTEGAAGVFTTVAGLRARTISLNARTVDATDGDSAGRWRELLAGAGVKSAAVSGQGIFRDAASDALIREAFFEQAARTWRLIVPDFGVLEGPFIVAALEYAGEHEGEASFALSLASAGEISFASI